MNTTRWMLAVSLVAGLAGACSGPGMSREAQATQEAAHAYGTQTASAPTSTPTPTRTPRPTVTPRPSSTPTPLPDLSAVILRLADLPAGYRAMPAAQFVGEPGTAFVTGDPIEASFAYARADAAVQVIAGVAARIDPVRSGVSFESEKELYVDMLVGAISAAMGEAQTGPIEHLEGMAGIGDSSAGATMLSNSGGVTTRIDLVLFQRGDVGVMIYMVYSEGSIPEPTILDVARLIDERAGTQLAGGADATAALANTAANAP